MIRLVTTTERIFRVTWRDDLEFLQFQLGCLIFQWEFRRILMWEERDYIKAPLHSIMYPGVMCWAETTVTFMRTPSIHTLTAVISIVWVMFFSSKCEFRCVRYVHGQPAFIWKTPRTQEASYTPRENCCRILLSTYLSMYANSWCSLDFPSRAGVKSMINQYYKIHGR